MFELRIRGGSLARPLSARPLTVGRAPGNDLVLDDDTLSSYHASLWTDGEAVWVQDLQSRNGSFLNGARVPGVAKAGVGDLLRLGSTDFELRRGAALPEDPCDGLVLVDLDTGLRTPFHADRLRIGAGPGVDLRLDGAPELVLGVSGPDDCWIGRDGDVEPLRVGSPFEVAGRRLVLSLERGAPRATRNLNPARYGYRLRATLTGGPGPAAWLLDLKDGTELSFSAENRATLLWLLARGLKEDRAAGRPEAEAGWVEESELITGVWGRAAGGTPANLRVLVCRIRRELKSGGLDPWFLEHRASHLRARVAEVVVED